MNSLAAIIPIMEKYGVTCSPQEFHRAVNLDFHEAESRVYDSIHQSMWQSLPQQMELLIGDCVQYSAHLPAGMRVLDVGCGTGLASELFIKSQLGSRISEVDLLDTSPEMLKQAHAKARTWPVKVNAIASSLQELLTSPRRYDVIIASSVLHHIPDLAEFCGLIRQLQAPAGIFLHLQDPNADSFDDPRLIERRQQLDGHRWRLPAKYSPSIIARRIFSKLTGRREYDYIEEANRRLLSRSLITRPMEPPDLWQITDIHDNDEAGISLRALTPMLSEYRLVSMRSYSFFGPMASELPRRFARQEQALIEQRAPNGMRFGALWQLAGAR